MKHLVKDLLIILIGVGILALVCLCPDLPTSPDTRMLSPLPTPKVIP